MNYTDEQLYTWAKQSIDNSEIYINIHPEAKESIINNTKNILKEYFLNKLSDEQREEFEKLDIRKQKKYLKKVIDTNGQVSPFNAITAAALEATIEATINKGRGDVDTKKKY